MFSTELSTNVGDGEMFVKEIKHPERDTVIEVGIRDVDIDNETGDTIHSSKLLYLVDHSDFAKIVDMFERAETLIGVKS